MIPRALYRLIITTLVLTYYLLSKELRHFHSTHNVGSIIIPILYVSKQRHKS